MVILELHQQLKLKKKKKNMTLKNERALQQHKHPVTFPNIHKQTLFMTRNAQTPSGDKRPSHATHTDVKQALGKFCRASLIN